MIITGQCNLEFRIGRLNHLNSFTHSLHRTFVHRNGRLFKPPLLTQVTGKIFQERTPVFSIGFLTRSSLDKLYAVGSLIKIIKAQRPWNHRVAANQILDTHFVHHELHPLVEHRIIVHPRTVQLLHPENHAIVMVFRLSGPRLVHDAGGNSPLPHIGQHLHDRTHGIKVLLAPQRHLIVTRHGIRILPQVQMKRPFLRFRQRTVHYLDFKRQFHGLKILSRHRQRTFILSGACISRYPYIQPHRLRTARLNFTYPHNIKHIGHHGRIPLCLILTRATTPTSILVQFIRHYITYKIRIHGRGGNYRRTVLQFTDSNFRSFQFFLRPKHSLCIHTLSFPSLQPERTSSFHVGHIQFLVTHIRRSPTKPNRSSHLTPHFIPVVRLRVGQFYIISQWKLFCLLRKTGRPACKQRR